MEAFIWGWNNNGEFGTGSTGGRKEEPEKIADDVVLVNLGSMHSGWVTSDGSLYMCGSNSEGQIGSGADYNSVPQQTTPSKVMDGVVSLGLGWGHSGAVTSDGSLYMWGSRFDGALGYDAEDEKNPTPEKIMDNVLTVSAGSFGSGAVTSDGSIYVWGNGPSSPKKIDIP